MVLNNVKLIEYSKRVDFFNCLTHAVGAAASVAALIFMVLKAEGLRSTASAVIYGVSLIAVYTVSAVYHGLKSGEAKRIARLIDHSTVPVLIAGTATPCAMVTLFDVSVPYSLLVLFLAWFCAVFGAVSKIFFFEKMRKVTVAVYIISCVIMLCSAVPLLDEISNEAFFGLLQGCILYLIGAAFCGLGIKRPALHVVFHVFVMLASLAHFLVIYEFVM
ncbi:MAG: hypothetical protein E7547_10055 [Ruminococcaceae bacterium]|nr:hypothetical protein [Oscillospiraceae bacterium]